MLKMLLDPMGGIVMTNDGNCILREVDVSHPAAKSMIELSRAQVGTSIHNNAVDTFNFTYIRLQEVYLTHTHTYIHTYIYTPFQDEEVGDGTTSVIILSGEILAVAEPLLERNFHPTVIVSGYLKALQVSVCMYGVFEMYVSMHA